MPLHLACLPPSQDLGTNLTTIRYTLPRSTAQLGCILVTEGHTTLPADLVGPSQVGGGGGGAVCRKGVVDGHCSNLLSEGMAGFQQTTVLHHQVVPQVAHSAAMQSPVTIATTAAVMLCVVFLCLDVHILRSTATAPGPAPTQ
jgi:hypothetical protein